MKDGNFTYLSGARGAQRMSGGWIRYWQRMGPGNWRVTNGPDASTLDALDHRRIADLLA